MSEMSSSTLALFIMLLTNVSVHQSSGQEECAEGCRSLRSGSTELSRCVKYACRKKVFRYYIRFGKRTSGTDETKNAFPTDNGWPVLQEPITDELLVNLAAHVNPQEHPRFSKRQNRQQGILSRMKRKHIEQRQPVYEQDAASESPISNLVLDESHPSHLPRTTMTRLYRLINTLFTNDL